jgi:hypothetical protein
MISSAARRLLYQRPEVIPMKRIGLALVLLSGCVGTTFNTIPVNAPPTAMKARPVDKVEVFSSDRPQKPYVDVAYLEADVTALEGPNNVVADLRARAAALGCDAIIFNGRDAKSGYAANCIVYRPARTAAANP